MERGRKEGKHRESRIGGERRWRDERRKENGPKGTEEEERRKRGGLVEKNADVPLHMSSFTEKWSIYINPRSTCKFANRSHQTRKFNLLPFPSFSAFISPYTAQDKSPLHLIANRRNPLIPMNLRQRILHTRSEHPAPPSLRQITHIFRHPL